MSAMFPLRLQEQHAQVGQLIFLIRAWFFCVIFTAGSGGEAYTYSWFPLSLYSHREQNL